MGYDLHITRCTSPNAPSTITADEWLACIRTDPELQLQPDHGPHFATWRSATQSDAWLDWHDGEIFSKNPDPPLIQKMIAIATTLHATVVGDDGETYPLTDSPAPTPAAKPSLLQRLAAIFSPRPKQTPPHKFHHLPVPFAVGDTVIDTFKNELLVISIDPTAEGGLGLITTRSRNGATVGHAMIAHDLKPKPKPPQPQ